MVETEPIEDFVLDLPKPYYPPLHVGVMQKKTKLEGLLEFI